MSIRTEPWPPGTPCWVDLGTPDVEAARAFYTAVLGWTYTGGEPEFGGYLNAQVGDHAAAGIGPQQDPADPTRWTTYFAVDDLGPVLQRVTDAGGTVIVEPMEVGPQGTMAMALDPQGTPFGLWKSGVHTGSAVVNEPGGLIWTEGESTDPDASRAYYAKVFDFTYEAVPEAGDYATFQTTGRPTAMGGIGGTDLVPSGDRPGWLTYFCVADTDIATAAARTHGAKVHTEPMDTPYGRLSVVSDPWGARFALMSAPPAGMAAPA